jgi:hypothetical protein
MKKDGEIMDENNNYFGECLYLNTKLLETIDAITNELFEMEESVVWCTGGKLFPDRNHDQVLQEFHLPLVADLLHIPCEA